MTIESNNKQSDQNSFGQAPGFEQNQDQAERKPSFGFFRGTPFGAPIARNLGSENFNKITEKLSEFFKSTENSNFDVKILALDKANEPALVFSVIIVTARFKNDPEKKVAYHVLIVEATGKKLDPYKVQMMNKEVQIQRYTGFAMDIKLSQMAAEKVRQAYPGHRSHFIDACVVPETFDPEDQRHMHMLAFNSSWAAGTELLIRTNGFKDMNLADYSNDINLGLSLNFDKQQISDVVGLPMRSDFSISFDSRQNRKMQEDRNIVNNGDRESQIAMLGGYVDLIIPTPSNHGNLLQYQNPMMMKQRYAARLVLTNLISNDALTPASVLLYIGTLLCLNDNNNWIQVFRSRDTSKKEIDFYDIGALNIDANIYNEPSGYGSKIDTKPDTFTTQDMGNLISSLVRQGMMLAVDCQVNGSQYWYLSMFSQAARKNKHAYTRIYEAANQLTNGAFGNMFAFGEQMFVDENNFIHAGYWTDKDGVKRDLRDFDLLAVCNIIGDTDPKFISDFSDTFYQTGYNWEIRLDARKNMIDALTKHTAVYTGIHHRVTFSDKFIEALSTGIGATGFKLTLENMSTINDFINTRAYANFVDNALIQPNSGFFVPNSFGGYAGSNAPFNNYRW